MNKIQKYFQDVRAEFRHVKWPTRQDAVRLTGVVIGLSLGIALFLGFFDYIFGLLLQKVVTR